MTDASNGGDRQAGSATEDQQREMAEVQEQLDAESEGDGLAAEAGSAEENGISQG